MIEMKYEHLSSKELAELELKNYRLRTAVIQNSDTNYKPEFMFIKEGMPATFYIGSDSYATELSDVNFFKSGTRKGLIKSVEIYFHGRTEVFKPKFYETGIVWQGEYGTLGLGYARDYRDPHF